MLKNELLRQSLRLETERFKLLAKSDKCATFYEYAEIKKEINNITVTLDQYKIFIDSFSAVKRKWLK
jgi:hypothetical protein